MSVWPMLARLAAGTALGVFFYGGLWYTVRRITAAGRPSWLTIASFWLRSGVVIAGFLLLIDRRWQYALISLAGFMLGRLAIARWLPDARKAG